MAKKARILIVEDEAIVAEDLEMAVTNIGYEVVGRAASAKDAVKKALETKPDLVLMDIVLRGVGNGIDASREIKEKMGVPIIFLTAYSDVELIDRAKSTEPYAYQVKPFQERQLFASIEMALYKSRAENELIESEERLRLVVENMPVMLDAFDDKGNIIVWNSECEKVTGFSSDEMICNHKGAKLLYPNEYYKDYIVSMLMRHGANFRNREWDITCKDGSVRTISWSNIAEKYPIPGWYSWAIGLDITEHKQAEAALQESEEKHRTLVETMDEGMVIADENENLTFVNHAASTIFGYTKEELLGKNLSDLTTAEEFQRVVDQTAIRKTGKSSQYESTIIRKDGAPRITVVTASPMMDDNGNYQGSFGVFRDITERKQAENALRESEEKYHLLANNTVDGIWQMNLDFEFTYVNPAIIPMLGFTQEEWVGSSLFDHCSSEDREFTLNLTKDMLKRGPESSGETFEMQLLHKNGERIDVEITAKMLFDDEGNPVGIQGATRAITERKRAEEKLKRLTLSLQEHVKELEESKRKIAEAYSLREYFLKETSHRIITPVAIIGGYTDLLLESSNLDDDQKQKLQILRAKDAEIQQLVNDSLAGKYLVEEE